MSETVKQVAAVISFIVSLCVGLYLAYLVYNEQVSLAIWYGLGGNLLVAGAIVVAVTACGSMVMYKGMHPY